MGHIIRIVSPLIDNKLKVEPTFIQLNNNRTSNCFHSEYFGSSNQQSNLEFFDKPLLMEVLAMPSVSSFINKFLKQEAFLNSNFDPTSAEAQVTMKRAIKNDSVCDIKKLVKLGVAINSVSSKV